MVKPQVEPHHYYNESYDSKGRFASYYHQINEIITRRPKTVLEVGIGNRLVSNYLKMRGINVITLDIDPRLRPDVAGSVLNMPFTDNSFEVVACYEVLEHLPYADFPKALSEIHRVSNRYAILSLPDSTRAYRLDIQIPKVGELKKLIQLPRLKPPVHEFDGEHYWEIGKAGYPLWKIMMEIQNAKFKVERTYRIFEMPYHRFFALEKL
jgi:hypothetical protein